MQVSIPLVLVSNFVGPRMPLPQSKNATSSEEVAFLVKDVFLFADFLDIHQELGLYVDAVVIVDLLEGRGRLALFGDKLLLGFQFLNAPK